MSGGALSLVAPRGRQQLAAAALVGVVRCRCATSADARGGAGAMSGTEALRSAGAMVSLTSSARLAGDKERAAGHGGTIAGMDHVPGDTPRRERRAPGVPASLRPSFTRVCGPRQRGQARAERLGLAGHSVWALDGTGSCSSQPMHAASGLHQVHRPASSTSAQPRCGAASLHPDRRAVVPLRPAPLVQQEGPENNQGARHGATRCMAKRRPDPPPLPCLVTEDSLRAHAPLARPCTLRVGTLSAASKQARRPLWARTCRRPSPLGAAPRLSGMTAPRGGASVSVAH